MDFTISGTPITYNLTSIVLESNREKPGELQLYHCWRCGASIFQFSGEPKLIVPGSVFSSLPIIAMCPRCRQRYLACSLL